MVELNDLLYWGSIAISLSDGDKLSGVALVKVDNGYIPIDISNDKFMFIENYVNVMSRLRDGDVLYIFNGCMYLGRSFREGPYGEDDVFLSEFDVESLDILEMVRSLEYKVSNNFGRKKKLTRIGEYYI